MTRTANSKSASAKGPASFTAGYLMLWANGAYHEDTEFLIDDFKVSETSLFEEGLVLSLPQDVAKYWLSVCRLGWQKRMNRYKDLIQ